MGTSASRSTDDGTKKENTASGYLWSNMKTLLDILTGKEEDEEEEKRLELSWTPYDEEKEKNESSDESRVLTWASPELRDFYLKNYSYDDVPRNIVEDDVHRIMLQMSEKLPDIFLALMENYNKSGEKSIGTYIAKQDPKKFKMIIKENDIAMWDNKNIPQGPITFKSRRRIKDDDDCSKLTCELGIDNYKTFKKWAALEGHPDKGGKKETFTKVYACVKDKNICCGEVCDKEKPASKVSSVDKPTLALTSDKPDFSKLDEPALMSSKTLMTGSFDQYMKDFIQSKGFYKDEDGVYRRRNGRKISFKLIQKMASKGYQTLLQCPGDAYRISNVCVKRKLPPIKTRQEMENECKIRNKVLDGDTLRCRNSRICRKI